jgi:hypothetical protein
VDRGGQGGQGVTVVDRGSGARIDTAMAVGAKASRASRSSRGGGSRGARGRIGSPAARRGGEGADSPIIPPDFLFHPPTPLLVLRFYCRRF